MSAKVFSLADFGSTKSKSAPKHEPKKPVASKPNFDSSDVIVVDPMKRIDIDRIHEHILSLYDSIVAEMDTVRLELDRLQTVIFSSIEEQVMGENKIRAVRLKLSNLEREAKKYEDYEDQAEVLIDQYVELIPDEKQRVVGGEEDYVESEVYGEFRVIVSQFVTLAQQFATNIQIVSQQASVEKCKNCHANQVMVGTKIHCSGCGHVTNLKQGSAAAAMKNEYYRSDNFEEHIAQFQGRQRKPIPPEVFQTIRDHCQTHHIELSKLTKAEILRILKRYKLSDHYNSLNSIGHSLIGSPLPDIREYEKALLERHRLVEREYMSIREEEGRSNFLHGWYVLRAFLMMEGYPANKEDFLTLTTRDALVEHDKLMMQMCSRIKERQLTDTTIRGNWNFKGLA